MSSARSSRRWRTSSALAEAVSSWGIGIWHCRVVADELRQRGIECTIGVLFAWRSNTTGNVVCDAMGIFLRGPVLSVRVLLGPEICQQGDET
eukprot:7714366-Lingulodinium_polyedra.AAC.1